jgi:uncharacterized membrane protein YeaQ/YmgE (transglycosylase-associated protein family)
MPRILRATSARVHRDENQVHGAGGERQSARSQQRRVTIAGPLSVRAKRLRLDAPRSGVYAPPRRTNNLEESSMLHLIWMFIVGIVVGAIARWIMPGAEGMGLFMTGLLGIAGSFVGGFIARIFSKPADGAVVHPAGIILSVIGALILLWAWSRFAH